MPPLTHAVFEKPVIIGNLEIKFKHVFEEWAIKAALERDGRCPITHARLSILSRKAILMPAPSIATSIEIHLTQLELEQKEKLERKTEPERKTGISPRRQFAFIGKKPESKPAGESKNQNKENKDYTPPAFGM